MHDIIYKYTVHPVHSNTQVEAGEILGIYTTDEVIMTYE